MDGSRRVADQLRARQVLVEGVVVEVGQQHAAHRRGVGGEARPDGDRHGHDPRPRRHPGDVHDVGSVEHRHRRRLVDRGDEGLHVGQGDLRQTHRGQVGEPELEHTRPQREVATVALHVAELDEREQESTGGGARQAGASTDVAEGQARMLAVEGADDHQAPFERLDEVRTAFVVVRASVGPGRCVRTPHDSTQSVGTVRAARGVGATHLGADRPTAIWAQSVAESATNCTQIAGWSLRAWATREQQQLLVQLEPHGVVAVLDRRGDHRVVAGVDAGERPLEPSGVGLEPGDGRRQRSQRIRDVGIGRLATWRSLRRRGHGRCAR